jgi:alpha-L-fucosidase 2
MARGGFEVDIDWENGRLKQARITSKLGNPLKLSYHGKVIELKTTEKGKSYAFREGASGLISDLY